MKKITERNQMVVDSLLEGKTYQAVADEYGITAQRVQQIYLKYRIIEAYNNAQNDLEKIFLECVDSNLYRYHIKEGFSKLGVDTIEKFLHTPLDDIMDAISCERYDPTKFCTVIDKDVYRKVVERCYRKAKKISKEKGLV